MRLDKGFCLNGRSLSACVALMLMSHCAGAQQKVLPPVEPEKHFHAPLYWTPYEYNIKADDYIPEAEWAANIDWVDKNLKPYGYKMVCIDGWGDTNEYNKYGYRTSHSSKWKHDYAWWSKNLQTRGMTLGIYNNPLWVNKAAADTGIKIEGTDIPLSSIINPNENAQWFSWVQVDKPGAEQYVKGNIKYYASIGVKYLRVDFLSWYETGHDRNVGRVGPARPEADYAKALRWMREACDEHGVFLSLVMPSLRDEAKVERQYGDMFRVDEDAVDGQWARFSDNNRGKRFDDWSQYSNPMDGLAYWSYLAGRHRVILDPDFLRMNTFANDDERKSVVSACFMAGAPVTPADQYDSIGDNLWVYQNREMLALNVDGFVGKPVSNDPTNAESQIWRGQMSNGDWVVGLFNRENSPYSRGIDFSSLGFTGKMYVRDLWRHSDLGLMSSYSVSIPPHGCVVIRLSRTKPSTTSWPEFSLHGHVFDTAQSLALTSVTPRAKIYYTLDGSTPGARATLYTRPIVLRHRTEIEAVARRSGLQDSGVATAVYHVNMPTALPGAWKSMDIGSVGVEGSTMNVGGAFVTTASGNDIEGISDSFRYLYLPAAGDVILTAKVAAQYDTNNWSKAGIMIRSSLDSGAKNVFVGLTPGYGIVYQHRDGENASTHTQGLKGNNINIWLRLVRKSGEVLTFTSQDGINWTPSGSTVLPGGTGYVGLAYTAHKNDTLGYASFTNVILSAGKN